MPHALFSAMLLAAFTIGATGLVVATHEATAGRIAEAERSALMERLHTLVPSERYDNELLADAIQVREPLLLGTEAPVTVYRARRAGQAVAAILGSVAPDGYGGDISLLVAVNHDGTVAGVRVAGHRETPGLGDKIEAGRSGWIDRFTGLSLVNPPPARWNVKKDGGAFDQFAGATITPRAVVRAVRNTLRFVQRHRDQVFAAPPPLETGAKDHE